MTGKTHLVVGINTVWLFVPFYGFVISPVIIALAAFGALLTDIDAAESKVKHLKVGYGKGRNKITIEPFYLPAVIIATFFKHRGFWHSLLANLLVAFVSLLIVQYIDTNYVDLNMMHWLAVPLGYLSHIVADSLTVYGVPYFWPWKRNLHLLPKKLRLVTSSYGDHILFAVGLLGVMFLMLNIFKGGMGSML